MTDPVRALEAVLRGIEATVAPHDADCIAAHSPHCDCTRPDRVRAEQARAWAASLNAMSIAMYVELSPDKCDEAALAAALRAGEEHQ